MQVKQIYELMNTVTQEVLGETAVVNEDLSNIVDIGDSVFGANQVDNYVKTLINHIGKVVFVNRPYSGNIVSVMMDGWEFGSILEKVTIELPEATVNESWQLVDGTSYDPNIFTAPKNVAAKFFNKRVTFEIPISITEKQVKESFFSADQLNGFISMIYNAIDKSMTIKLEKLVMELITNFIGETLYNEFPSGTYTGTSSVKAVNLLHLYNTQTGESLTANKCLGDPAFIRFAAYTMGVISERLTKISTLFNIGGTDKFTPKDYLRVVMLSDFAQAANVYLQSDTFHNEFTALPTAETVPYWQGSGTGYAFNDITKIDVKTASGNTVEATGILGVMFDKDALAVTNPDRRTTSLYNPKAEFFNNWFKYDAQYLEDTNENFVVFYVA